MGIIIPRTIGPIPVDVVMEEVHVSTLAITRNPVEFGADVTDHAYVEPKMLRMLCFIGGGRAKAAAAYNALVALQESREPFDVVTGLTLYRDMLIENITAPRHVDNKYVLEFSIDLLEIIFAHSAHAPSVNQADGQDMRRGSGTTDRGQVSPTEVPPETIDDPTNSLLHDMLN